jgi:cell division protein FtsB
MIVRTRARAVLLPLLLYAVSGAAGYYFVHHAHYGERGLEAKKALKIEAAQKEAEFEKARTERLEWERRLSLLKSDQIDRDLLEERARITLGRVHRNDLVIITGYQP